MTSEEIEIRILPGGHVEYTIKGVKGSACESISTLLEQLGKVEQKGKTGEYYDHDEDVRIAVSE